MTQNQNTSSFPSREAVLKSAGEALSQGILRTMSMDPREAAEAAYIPRVTPSVDELEAQIRRFHAEAEARAECGQNVGKALDASKSKAAYSPRKHW